MRHLGEMGQKVRCSRRSTLRSWRSGWCTLLLMIAIGGTHVVCAQEPAPASQPQAPETPAQEAQPEASQPQEPQAAQAPQPQDQPMQQEAPPQAAPSESAPASQVRAVRLSNVEGGVQLLTGGTTGAAQFIDAHTNAPLTEGSRVQTGQDGRAEIQFEDGSVARLTPNTSLSLNQLRRSANAGTVTDIEVLSGLAYFELNNRAGQYTVRFGPTVVTPTEQSSFRVNLDANPAEVAVQRGAVHVDSGQANALDVTANQTVRMDGADSGRSSVIDSVVADSWDQWNADRDKALAYMESSQTSARAGAENSGDPGWNDLDYYGDWYDAPGYGMVWSPSGVGADFDPYGSGYWGYSQGLGYSWISSYPWGWMPYHCGSWTYMNSFGWGWMPSGCGYGYYGGGWYPFTPVYSGPAGYRPPVRPVLVRGGIPHQRALIPVRRVGTSSPIQWRPIGSPKPVARTLPVRGIAVAPVSPIYHPRTTGPLGEGFGNPARSGVVPANPGYFNRGNGGPPPVVHTPIAPSRGGMPPMQTYHPAPAPRYTPPQSAAPRSSPPSYSPPPAPHMSGGGNNGGNNGGGKPR